MGLISIKPTHMICYDGKSVDLDNSIKLKIAPAPSYHHPSQGRLESLPISVSRDLISTVFQLL